jgi:hypothetical protein
MNGDNGEDEIRQDCKAADDIRRVVEDVWTPAFPLG